EGTPADPEARQLLHQVQTTQKTLQAEAQTYLDRVAGRLRDRGLNVETRVAIDDHPAAAILHEAQALQAGLIALETHGRPGLPRLIRGGVAAKVARGAHVPILVHRPSPP